MENFKAEKNFTKTGTTIVGLKFRGGVVLLADMRATAGPIVVDKQIEKLHKVTESIYCAGAGTAADTIRINNYASKYLNFYAKKYDRHAPIDYYAKLISTRLHNHGGHLGAELIAGGLNYRGEYELYSLSSHGSYASVEYTTSGSGTYASLGILESGYREEMSREEAIELGKQAVLAGVKNDLYSGTGVSVVLMEDGQVTRDHIIYFKEDEDQLNLAEEEVHIKEEEIFKYVDVVN